MPGQDKLLANITFDLMDFVEDDPEALAGLEDILEDAVEEWLEANGYEDWDVSNWGGIDTPITITDVELTPEQGDDD